MTTTEYPRALRALDMDERTQGRVDHALTVLAPGAAERDAAGGPPTIEVDALRESGLLIGPWAPDSFDKVLGWDSVLAAVAGVATMDPSSAFLLGYHHMHLHLLTASGNPRIAQWATQGTAEHGWYWGGANNPSGQRVTVTPVPGGYELDGAKEFATGSLGADRLIIQEGWPTEDSPQRRIVLVVDGDAPGVSVLDDWDGIGVRRSATARIQFDRVHVPAERFVKWTRVADAHPAVSESAMAPGFQVLFANAYFGIAVGALRRAFDQLLPDGAPSRRASLTQVQETLGELIAPLGAARAKVAEANHAFAAVVSRPTDDIASDEFARLAHEVWEAKLFVHEMVLGVTQRAFELTGSRGAFGATGLDRFWRDARNHSLHDEIRVRYRFLGAAALGVEPG